MLRQHLQRVQQQLQLLLRGALRQLGSEVEPATASPQAAPLDQLRRLWAEIDEMTTILHSMDPLDVVVVASRRRLREGLAAASAIEGRLVDAMLAA